jgi:ABC-type glycerol-3-phosphate transport system permease component
MSLLTRNKAPKVAEQNAGRKLFGSRGATISVWIIAVLWTIPTLGLFATSLRPKAAISETGWWQIFLHPHFTLSNYTAIFSTGTVSGISNGILPYFINSFVITIPAVVFPIALATMAAYCLAWVKFKGSDAIFYGLFALQIVSWYFAKLSCHYLSQQLQRSQSSNFSGCGTTFWLLSPLQVEPRGSIHLTPSLRD